VNKAFTIRTRLRSLNNTRDSLRIDLMTIRPWVASADTSRFVKSAIKEFWNSMYPTKKITYNSTSIYYYVNFVNRTIIDGENYFLYEKIQTKKPDVSPSPSKTQTQNLQPLLNAPLITQSQLPADQQPQFVPSSLSISKSTTHIKSQKASSKTRSRRSASNTPSPLSLSRTPSNQEIGDTQISPLFPSDNFIENNLRKTHDSSSITSRKKNSKKNSILI